jgi:hypothetical protein
MAADGESTEPDSSTSHQVDDKVWADGGLLLGYTGNTAVRDPLRLSIATGLAAFDTTQGRYTVANGLCEWIARVLDPLYANYVPRTATMQDKLATLRGMLLVIGRDEKGFWLLDIDCHCTVTPHWDRGFHTVGSGSHAAEVVKALLDHHDLSQIDLWKLKLVAYRSVATCIKVGGPLGVGGAVHLWSAEVGGDFEEARGTELEGLQRNVQEWEQTESELFNNWSQETPDPLPEAAPATSEPTEPELPSERSQSARKA